MSTLNIEKDNNAIVTLAIGDKYYSLWKKYCKHSWEKYAAKYDLDIIVIDQMIDTSERANNRSPAWQKCLTLNQNKIKYFDQVAWIDSDIVINHCNAPNIFDEVPLKKLGAVNYYSIPSSFTIKNFQHKVYNYYKEQYIEINKDFNAYLYYANSKLEKKFNKVIHTGVMICSPKNHNYIFEKTYNDYANTHPHYEMPFLSFEILKNTEVKWLNPEFNALWLVYKFMYYDYLIYKKNNFLLKLYRQFNELSLTQEAIKSVFNNNYFLHFAGSQADMLKTGFLNKGKV